MKLSDIALYGISSMLRELGAISPNPDLLESCILDAKYPIPAEALKDLHLITSGWTPQVGDVVVFTVRTMGAYPDMETLWGDRVPLVVGRAYIGVMCNRLSSRLICALLPTKSDFTEEYDFQLVAQAGGIGHSIGFSESLRNESGSGIPSDVEILGVISNKEHRVLNTIEIAPPRTDVYDDARPPIVLCVGTATDVGKTTAIREIVNSVAPGVNVAAIKASGTGWYEDTLLHTSAGANAGFNMTMVGLPTTYNTPPDLLRVKWRHLLDWASDPSRQPSSLRAPNIRQQAAPKIDLIVIEHGGDVIEAGIPVYLGDQDLMRRVIAIILCSESAIAAVGGLNLMRALSGNNLPPCYAVMPFGNPEGFYQRVRQWSPPGCLAGVVDFRKPDIADSRTQRIKYAQSYSQILGTSEFSEHLASLYRSG